MQSLPLQTFISSEAEDNNSLNVFIAYEDFETGKRAIKTYNYLVEHLGHECIFTNQMWKFDVLSVPKLREIAIRDAVGAQILIIALHGNNPLPPQVEAWAESWSAYNGNAVALVALFENLSEFEENPARYYLAGLARRCGIEFFCQPVWSGAVKHTAFSAGERSGKAFSALANVLEEQDRAVRRWGINE
jgi:hypothetical protein